VPAPALEQAIGYSFTGPEILEEALTHPSALASERSRGRHTRKPAQRGYERLEFLGDRLLALIDEMEGPPRDPKTALQEWAQARALALPTYELIGTSGPDHALRFTVEARVAGHDGAKATASSKRSAEAKAAELLLEILGAEASRG